MTDPPEPPLLEMIQSGTHTDLFVDKQHAGTVAHQPTMSTGDALHLVELIATMCGVTVIRRF